MAASFLSPSRQPDHFRYYYYALITLLHPLRLRPLSLHTSQVRWRLFTIFSRLPDCTGAHYQTAQLRGASNFRASTHIFYYQTARNNHPDYSCFFPRRKPIILNIIIMHLIHSYIHCDLDNSCYILHKSRDLHFSVGKAIFPPGSKFSLYISLLSDGNHTYFQIWRRRGGSHVTGEVEGVILFLAKRLPPLG